MAPMRPLEQDVSDAAVRCGPVAVYLLPRLRLRGSSSRTAIPNGKRLVRLFTVIVAEACIAHTAKWQIQQIPPNPTKYQRRVLLYIEVKSHCIGLYNAFLYDKS